jgi:archaellin
MATNKTNHTNTSKYPFSYFHQPSSNILRHISTPSLELIHNNNQTNSMNLTRSSFGRNNIRKKQPRTNPNYVNIQIKSNDGTLRSTYIRLDDTKKCQTLTFSPSSSSSTSSEQNSNPCNSQICLNQSNENFPSNETINNTDILTNKKDLMMKQFITCTDGNNIILREIKQKKKDFI